MVSVGSTCRVDLPPTKSLIAFPGEISSRVFFNFCATTVWTISVAFTGSSAICAAGPAGAAAGAAAGAGVGAAAAGAGVAGASSSKGAGGSTL
jgi:hypothetical protein